MNYSLNPDIFVIDNFYDDPLSVREKALTCEYMPLKTDNNYVFGNAPYPGKVSREFYNPKNLDLAVSKLLGKHARQILNQNSSRFRLSNLNDKADNFVHRDFTGYAGVCYLNPDINNVPGTIFYTHKETKTTTGDKELYKKLVLNNDVNDPLKWDINFTSYIVFNRLIIYPAESWHGIGPLFGTKDDDARLVQLFFWEILN